jgi:hypothetical protein
MEPMTKPMMMIPPTVKGENKLRLGCVVSVMSPKSMVISVTFEK